MSVPKRHGNPPGTYFLTSRTWGSRRIFNKEAARTLFVETLMNYRDDGAYALHSFVLMPDHFHALLTPAGDRTVERVMQYIKGGSAHAIREKLNFSFPVWQRGFSDHRIRDGRDFESHVRYIHMNPVEGKLSVRSEDYPWSSACGRWRLDAPPQQLKPLEIFNARA